MQSPPISPKSGERRLSFVSRPDTLRRNRTFSSSQFGPASKVNWYGESGMTPLIGPQSAATDGFPFGLQVPSPLASPVPRVSISEPPIEMRPLRPAIIRALSANVMPAAPHGIGMNPERTDFFVLASDGHESWQPVRQLAAVVIGRVTLAMSLGGISTGFVPHPPLAPNITPKPVPGAVAWPGDNSPVNPRILAASAGGIALGTFLTAWGLGAFAKDTWEVNPRRAAFMASLSAIGVLGVAGGGLIYIVGQDRDDYTTRWLASIPRTIGNFCVFYALPNAFATSEIVHGRAPIPNREHTRQLMFAFGGAMMMFWAHISSPGLNAPLYAREIAQSIALVGLCVGAALARSDTLRLESARRSLAQRRETSADEAHARAVGAQQAQPMPCDDV